MTGNKGEDDRRNEINRRSSICHKGLVSTQILRDFSRLVKVLEENFASKRWGLMEADFLVCGMCVLSVFEVILFLSSFYQAYVPSI